jgi:hypothetical protein
MRAIINRNADPKQGRLKLNLQHDSDGRWRWYDDGTASEVSGQTVAEAHEAAESAWGSGGWDLATENELLDRALTALTFALGHDEAVIRTDNIEELAHLRQFWVPKAEQIIDDAEDMGVLYDDMDDEE